MSDKSFTVFYWGSHPEKNNDDCYTGFDFPTQSEAERFFNAEIMDPYYRTDVEYIELDGIDGVTENPLRKNPHFRPSKKAFDREWLSEQANEAGMLHGIAAYNETMGW